MVFNIDKCEVLQISLSNSTPRPVNYCLYDNPLRIVKEVKYLGVLLDSLILIDKKLYSYVASYMRKQMVC